MKVIKKIKEGAHKVYSEQVYVDAALMPGILITFLSGMFLIISIVFSGTSGSFPLDIALIGTLIGIIVLTPGIIVWLYHRNTYSFLGFRRFQVALSITALELSNLGHQRIQPIISPSYPAEYEYLPLFIAVGPGNLLKRMKGVLRSPATLDAMLRQSERFAISLSGVAGVMSLLGSLLVLLVNGLTFVMNGSWNLFLLLLGLFMLILGIALVLHTRYRLGALRESEPSTDASDDISQFAETSSTKASVEDALSFIHQRYAHPIRLLVVETYSALEYTGRVYYTGDGIELREAYLLPTKERIEGS